MKLKAIALICCIASLAATAVGQETSGTKELKREDFVGAAGMEVITSLQEIKPGESIPRHTHHGSEAGYVVQGAAIQAPGKDPTQLVTGASFLFARDIPHAGFKVIGDASLKLFTVHIVDKGKPLYEPVQ